MAEKQKMQKKEPEKVSRFTKNQLLGSSRYAHCRDLLTALLDENKTYSHKDVEDIVGNFMKGKVE